LRPIVQRDLSRDRGEIKEVGMTRHFRTATLVAILTLGSELLLTAPPAMAQGPYGRNSYEDWPFNQGSLFYRPLKPKPRARVARRTFVRPSPAPYQGGYTYTQPRYYYPQGAYYYYPTNPGYAAPH